MKKLKKLLYAEITKRYMAGCSNYNSLEVRRGCRSKEQARAKFEEHNVPHAKGLIFFSPWKALRFAEAVGYPLCVKPNVSGFSRGSYFPINNKAELWRAILLAKLWWPRTVVEQYLLGSNYRVLTTDTQLASVIQRYPPFVDGDGQHTIAELIDAENAVRQQMNLHPTIYPIKKSPDIQDYLAKQGMDFDSVIDAGARVHLFHRVALAPGGVVEIVDQSTIPEVNRKLFIDVVQMFGARVLGIDVIFEKGIEVPYTEQRCIFLEVNSRPYMKMHEYPRYGEKENLSAFYAEMESYELVDADTF
jgi:D-alanine-D-alanine ligase-like ATP-grasp enzyme